MRKNCLIGGFAKYGKWIGLTFFKAFVKVNNNKRIFMEQVPGRA